MDSKTLWCPSKIDPPAPSALFTKGYDKTGMPYFPFSRGKIYIIQRHVVGRRWLNNQSNNRVKKKKKKV